MKYIPNNGKKGEKMKQTINLKWIALCILLVAIPVLVLGIVGYNAAKPVKKVELREKKLSKK